MHILLVDDDEDVLHILGLSLQGMGHETESCFSAEAAKSHLASHAYRTDLVMTDVLMSGEDGLSLLQDLRDTPGAPPVVVMSGQADLPMAIAALRRRAIDFITKPFSESDLHECLERVTVSRATLLNATGVAGVCLDQTYRLVMPTSRQWITPVCHQVVNLFASVEDEALRKDLRLGLLEALNNAVIHGNLEVSSEAKNEGDWMGFENQISDRLNDPKHAGRKVTVEAHYRDGELRVSVEDEGSGFDPNLLPEHTDPEALLASGRGIMLIRFAMDEVSWNARGNRVEMIKRF